jgi:methionine-rich copper-binding protein CopC
VQIERKTICATLLSLVCVAGCAGNGVGLDQNGQPITAGDMTGGPIQPTLESIEENVFAPICAKCHIGASAPEGLQLDTAAHAYNFLVGVPSAEEPSFQRVNPGNPDLSYMILKIEGASGIEGGQMPLGETPLPQATIDAIRQWVTNGAPNVPGAAAASEVFAVQATAPVDKATVNAPLARILVTFTQEVDASLINDSTVTLERMGDADTDPEAAATAESGEKIAAVGALAEHNPAVLLITPSKSLASGVYRVSVRGTGGGAIANLNASPLGSDTSFVFTVEPAQ